jgi:hypothetical protein
MKVERGQKGRASAHAARELEAGRARVLKPEEPATPKEEPPPPENEPGEAEGS